MVILEKPYISEILLRLLESQQISVLRNDVSQGYESSYNLKLIDDSAAIAECKKGDRVYTISENALEWVYQNHPDKSYVEKIDILKDKTKFRDLCKSLYPDFYYKQVNTAALQNIDADKIPYPVILKPSVGFFSVGVYTIENKEDWAIALKDIYNNFDAQSSAFPSSVIEKSNFIIEEYIKGTEFAVDSYYDKEGNPVILNIYKHPFLSDKDVSDRLYFSSKDIYDKYLEPFLTFLKNVNSVLNMQNFPFHIEFRVDESFDSKSVKIQPIEMNPMRFAGLCVNDIACYIYGFHPVKSYLENYHPDYENIWNGNEDNIFAFVILEKSEENKGREFDFEKLTTYFEKNLISVLELRKVNNIDLAAFGFVYIKVLKSKRRELEDILKLNVSDYLK